MVGKVVGFTEEEKRLIEKEHQDRLAELNRMFDKVQEDLRKEINSYSSFDIISTKNDHGVPVYYRRYKDGRLSTPFGSKEGCLKWYLDGGR